LWQQYWGTGYFVEDSEKRPVNILKNVEKKKLLSSVEKAGLLSLAEKAGITLSKARTPRP
jgi:Protein of unknown function (DUF1118)